MNPPSLEDGERPKEVKSIATPTDVGETLFENVATSVAGPTSKFTESQIENELPALRKTTKITELMLQH